MFKPPGRANVYCKRASIRLSVQRVSQSNFHIHKSRKFSVMNVATQWPGRNKSNTDV